MPEKLTIIFDFDGTLSNLREGIVKAINFPLQAPPAGKRPDKYIGTTLKTAFSNLTGIHERFY